MPNPWLFDPAKVRTSKASTSPTSRRSKSINSPMRPCSSPLERPDPAPSPHTLHHQTRAVKRKPKQRPSTASPVRVNVVTQKRQPFAFAFHQSPPVQETVPALLIDACQ